jgi:RecJ-like exonuclease
MGKGGTVVIIDVECPRCNGAGEVLGDTPNARSRYVHYDDLNPGDFGEACGKCGGSGVVELDLDEECDDAEL